MQDRRPNSIKESGFHKNMINNFFFPQPLGHNKEPAEITPRLTKLSFIGIPVLRVFQENNKTERYNFNKIKSERD